MMIETVSGFTLTLGTIWQSRLTSAQGNELHFTHSLTRMACPSLQAAAIVSIKDGTA
jgi:hypothetical protein